MRLDDHPVAARPEADGRILPCRLCGAPLTETFVDLGMSPLCERFLRADQLDDMEPFYPLHVRVCSACLLVQLPEYVAPAEIFTEYAYFSSYSDSWVEHARRFAADMTARLGLGPASRVIEVASNDGYLLRHFRDLGIPVQGIDPAKNVAEVAIERGIPTITEFLDPAVGARIAAESGPADLVVGNNVFAHVPDLNGFTAGLRALLAPGGTLSLEFPHLVRLVDSNQFDTIYHEHFSYFTLHTAAEALRRHRLRVIDLEELASHGGSLRVIAAHEDDPRPASPSVERLLAGERAAGYTSLEGHRGFAPKVARAKGELLRFLIDARAAGRTVAGYGAPGKANTLLTYCGIDRELLAYTVDRNPYKHGLFTPGMHIPILPPETLTDRRPDIILILPWNLQREIARQLEPLRALGSRLYVPIPEVGEVA